MPPEQLPLPIKNMILGDLRVGVKPFKLSREYGVHLKDIIPLAEQVRLEKDPTIIETIFDRTVTRLVPKWAKNYIIQIRRVDDQHRGWIMNARLKQAHYEYDAGLVEVATGRIRCPDTLRIHEVLYAIPRKKPTSRQPYFSVRCEG